MVMLLSRAYSRALSLRLPWASTYSPAVAPRCSMAARSSRSGSTPWVAAFQRRALASVVLPLLVRQKSAAPPSSCCTSKPPWRHAAARVSAKPRQGMVCAACRACATRAGLGACICRHAAMQPTTKIGRPPSAPTTAYCAGSRAKATSAIRPTSAKLIHQGERSSTANRELGGILNFTEVLLLSGWWAAGGRRHCPATHGVESLG